jgi:hypothetical protein
MNANQALQFLETLRSNYLRLAQQVDIELMSRQRFDMLIEQNAPYEPLLQGAQFGRQGAIIAAWSLWEYYSRVFCEGLPAKNHRKGDDSCVDWVGKCLDANNLLFPNQDWFLGANALRNLIAHYSGSVTEGRAQTLFEKARIFFPELELFRDDYVAILSEHVSSFYWNIKEFVRGSA